jgi:DNA invertase Pin-like site-specific DNA recombinase
MGMLADLLGNSCRVIIVERLDRLAREFRVQEELLLYLMRKELTLISADTGEDITAAMNADPMRRFVVQLQGLLAELDKNLTVAKLSKARKAVRDRGEYAGGNPPYGHLPRRGSAAALAQAENERLAARRIRELRAMGLTLREVREIITAEGWKPRTGRIWQLSSIRAIAIRPERGRATEAD